ncbi:hypothetical protein [Polaribacter sp. Asnod6-C07]|uniref:hypothetical protein n=1 Tax=Polaribacter sp. Asnod6-C07 TaxID=3160582 RepID=UPI003864AC99
MNCEAIFVEDISSETVILIAPSENSDVISGNIQFNWQEVPEANEYQIQIATPNFDNAVQIILDSTQVKTYLVKDLEIGDYEWRVKAYNSGYSTNYASNNLKVK